jgi:hypothetical protein
LANDQEEYDEDEYSEVAETPKAKKSTPPADSEPATVKKSGLMQSDFEASEGEYEQVGDDELDPNMNINPDPALTNAIQTVTEKALAS